MNQNERREFLRNKDLEMSKQIDKIIKESQPIPPKDIQPLLLKPVYPKIELTGTPEYKANKQMTDLLLAQQLENTITEAMNAVTGTQTAPTSNTVPQTMTDEYIKANEVDINTDQKTLYNSVPIPVVPKPIPKRLPFKHIITEEDYKIEKERLINLHVLELEQRDRIMEAEKHVEDLINTKKFSGIVAFDEAARRAEIDTKGPTYMTVAEMNAILKANHLVPAKKREDVLNRFIEFEKNEASGRGEQVLLKNLASIKNDLLTNSKDITQIENDMKAWDGIYGTQEKTIEKNKEQENNYEAALHQAAEELLDNFNLLNTGKVKVERQTGETDAELIKRIENLSKAPVNAANVQNQIVLKTFNQAKKNVLELTSELDKAETVVKSLDIKEQDAMNKMFPKIKEDFKSNFGINNKSLTDDDIVQFIKNEITTGNTLMSKKPPAEYRQFEKAELQVIIDHLNSEDPTYNLTTGTIPQMADQIMTKGLWNYPKFRAILKHNPRTRDLNFGAAAVATPIPNPVQSSNKGVVGFMNALASPPKARTQYATPEEEEYDKYLAELTNTQSQFEESPHKKMKGDGIKNHDLPSSVPFGKIAMDLNKLFYQNILSIKRHNGNKIIGHRNKRVSDNFVDIIMKMFENKPVTQSDLKNIKDERLLYDNLIVQSGLHKSKSIPTTIEQTSQEMKNRLGLIVGEIEAGNSNKSLLPELHELLFKMVRVHLISKSAATKYFNNLKTEFYVLNPDLK